MGKALLMDLLKLLFCKLKIYLIFFMQYLITVNYKNNLSE